MTDSAPQAASACEMATACLQGQISANPGHAIPFYRSFNGHDHFYTTDLAEHKNSLTIGYTEEGFAGYIFPCYEPRTVPLYRLYWPQKGDHFYTTDAKERDNATDKLPYVDEGVSGWVFTDGKSGGMPLYRLLRSDWGDHFYTVSASEADNAVANAGFQKEGIAAYIYPF